MNTNMHEAVLNKAVDDLALVAKSLLESLKDGSNTDTRIQDVVTSFGHNRGDLIKIVVEQNITDPAVIFAFPSIKFIFLRSELEKIEEQDGTDSNDEVQKRFALNLLPAFQFMESYIAKGTCDGLPSTNIVQIVEGLIGNMNTFVNNIVCDKGSSVMKTEEEELMTNRDLNTEIQGGFKPGDLVAVVVKQDVSKFEKIGMGDLTAPRQLKRDDVEYILSKFVYELENFYPAFVASKHLKVVAGAAMVLRGVRESTLDIDIHLDVPKDILFKIFPEYQGMFSSYKYGFGINTGILDIVLTPITGEHSPYYKQDFLVSSLIDILRFKLMLDRPKDQADIEDLKEAIGRRGEWQLTEEELEKIFGEEGEDEVKGLQVMKAKNRSRAVPERITTVPVKGSVYSISIYLGVDGYYASVMDDSKKLFLGRSNSFKFETPEQTYGSIVKSMIDEAFIVISTHCMLDYQQQLAQKLKEVAEG